MIKTCGGTGIAQVSITRVNGAGSLRESDDISVEEPLQILVGWEDKHGSHTNSVAITMRTPGDDESLAVGFLFTEGIIAKADAVKAVEVKGQNVVHVMLRPGIGLDLGLLDRHSFVSSSCGACGKRTIAAVRVTRRHKIQAGTPGVAPRVIRLLPDILREAQAEFSRTGGIHASALFDARGRLLALREDVGRHNALDKLIGSELMAGHIPLDDRIILVSGRVSFELVQKAALAGVPVVAAVGAPSSLAVELATECGMTLLGFVRDQRFNVYADCGRVLEPAVSRPKQKSLRHQIRR